MAGYLRFLDSFRPFNYSREAAHFGKNWYVWSGRCLQAIKMRNNYQNISSGEIIYLFSAFKGNFMSDWESQQFSQQSSLLLAPHMQQQAVAQGISFCSTSSLQRNISLWCIGNHSFFKAIKNVHTHTHTLALLAKVKRQAFCVRGRLKMVKHKSLATTSAEPILVGSMTTKQLFTVLSLAVTACLVPLKRSGLLVWLGMKWFW